MTPPSVPDVGSCAELFSSWWSWAWRVPPLARRCPRSIGTEAAVFLRPVSGQSADAFALARLVEDALETSRELNRVDIPGENVMQLAAPVALVRKASPTSVTVSYEIRPVRGHDQSFSTTCAAGDLERCVRNIILHTERMARLDPSRR